LIYLVLAIFGLCLYYAITAEAVARGMALARDREEGRDTTSPLAIIGAALLLLAAVLGILKYHGAF